MLKYIEPYQNFSIFRARINEKNSDGKQHNTTISLKNMGAPPNSIARHGRANPRGIPYLYLANDQLTAISEVRPWVGCYVSIATLFSTMQPYRRYHLYTARHSNHSIVGRTHSPQSHSLSMLVGLSHLPPPCDSNGEQYIPAQYTARH